MTVLAPPAIQKLQKAMPPLFPNLRRCGAEQSPARACPPGNPPPAGTSAAGECAEFPNLLLSPTFVKDPASSLLPGVRPLLMPRQTSPDNNLPYQPYYLK